MTSGFAIATLAVLATGSAYAQGQVPTTGSTAGVTIVSPGRSIKPQELTPSEPFRPRAASATERNKANREGATVRGRRPEAR